MYIANNLTELKKKAIRITKDTEFYCPIPIGMPNGPCKTERLNPEVFSEAYMLKYNLKNGVISFIDENLSWFVIPALNGVEKFLKACGFVRAGIYIPCSDEYSYPLKEKRKWNALVKMCKEGF